MNRISKLLLLLLIVTTTSCKSTKKIFIENSKINGTENPYNYDNKIFTSEIEYIFDYVIIKDSDSLKYEILDETIFDYKKKNEISNNIVACLSIKTLKNKGPIFIDYPNYTQTEIILSHLDKNGVPLTRELTGVIENNINLWLHPFRINAFQILQFTPFPYIKPNEKKPYYWNLQIGKHWEKLKDINWYGNLNLKCKYENIAEEDLIIPIGKFKITKTVSSCKSKIGINYLTSYYNKDLGFIKLEYNLINNEKIIFILKNINFKK